MQVGQWQAKYWLKHLPVENPETGDAGSSLNLQMKI